MPELPEVETTCRGIAPLVTGETITKAVVRNRNLRWPVTPGLNRKIAGQSIIQVWRRGKYILITLNHGSLIIHLGMSGHLRFVDANQKPVKHDHVDIFFKNHTVLRYHDPRRFGAVLWTIDNPLNHKLLSALGPEPLAPEFSAEYLFAATRKRKRIIRDSLLDGSLLAGVGNIYANESLFKAGIDPRRAAGSISKIRYQRLVPALIEVLRAGIAAGGTSLKDFKGVDGRPGYFQQHLNVYGRTGKPCRQCGRLIKSTAAGGRSLFFCNQCQN